MTRKEQLVIELAAGTLLKFIHDVAVQNDFQRPIHTKELWEDAKKTLASHFALWDKESEG